jgi:hypothetical protein
VGDELMDAERKVRQPAPAPDASGTPASIDAPSSVASPVWADAAAPETTTGAGSPTSERQPEPGQRSLRVSPKESAADALADRALHDSPPKGPLRGLQPPKGPAEVEIGAAPLPEPVRKAFEHRFGADLSAVRVKESDDTATRMGAQAFSAGRVISFAPGAWDPNSHAGRGLIAHELAHVVLAESEPAAVASKKDAAAPLWYADVQDQFNEAFGLHELALRPIANLCQVVDAEQVADVKKAIDDLAAVDISILPPHLPSTATAGELMSRLALLGMPDEVIRYRNWQVKLPGVTGPPATSGPRYFDSEAWYWDEMVVTLRSKVNWTSGTEAMKVLDAYLGLIPVMDKERRGLDPQQIKDDETRLAADTSPSGYGFGMQSGPYLTISRYAGKLARLLLDTFSDAQAPLQSVIDLAVADLKAGKGSGLLDQVEQRLVTIAGLPMLDRGIEINETKWEKKAGKDVLIDTDSFPDQPGAAKRRTQIDSYDAELLSVRPSQEVTPGRMLVIRQAQVKALRQIYGVEKVGGVVTAEAAENTKALKTLGKDGLRLHNDDDWRAFLLAKFKEHLAGSSAADAFDSLVELLKVYLHAFTTHTPFNIDDFGDNQLTQQFPRALTGQLVHDCGVYALRIAYMLSLVREDPALKLQFRFVQLPVHIGLVITSSSSPIGAYLINNDTVDKYDDTELEAIRQKWDVTDEKGDPRTAVARTKATDDQFLGELDAKGFVPFTETPYKVTDVPHVGGTSGTTDKATLWATYQSTLKNKMLGKVTEDPKDPDYQFHLRYLGLLDKMKIHHNTQLVPYWNTVAHAAWADNLPALTAADAKRGAAKTPAEKKAADDEFAAARTKYLGTKYGKTAMNVVDGLSAVHDAYAAEVVTVRDKLTLDLVARKKELVGPGASEASAARLLVVLAAEVEPDWWRAVADHLTNINKGLLATPPYAKVIDPVD